MPKRDRINYDIGSADFGDDIISVAKNGGDYTTIKDAIDSLQSSGTATDSGVGVITDSGASWDVDYFAGGSITITGTGAGTYTVTSNTLNTITFDYVGTPAADCGYIVWRASVNKKWVIKVMPGQYTEDNDADPIRLLDYVNIVGEQVGLDYVVDIVPSNVDKSMFRSSVGGYGGLKFLSVSDVTNANGLIIDSGDYNYMFAVAFVNCSIGILVDGAGVFSYLDYCERIDCGTGLKIDNGADVWDFLGYTDCVMTDMANGTVDGSGVGYIEDSTASFGVDHFLDGGVTIGTNTYQVLSNTQTRIYIKGMTVDPSAVGMTYLVWVPVYDEGICVVNGSTCVVSSSDILGPFSKAVCVDDGSILEFNSLRIDGGSIVGLRVESGGGKITGNAVYLSENTVYHMVDDTVYPVATAIFRVNGTGNSSRVVSTNSSSAINFYGYDEVYGDEGFVIGGRFKSPWQESIFVSRPGRAIGDYTTIKAAINAITDASVSKPYTIFVYPGIYPEDNPITLKPYVSLIGIGGAAATTISANNVDSNLIVLDVAGQMQGLTFSGATGASGIYYSSGASAAAILDTAVGNCLTGVTVTGTDSQVYMSRIRFTGTMTNPVVVDSGAKCFLKTARILSSGADRAISVTGASNLNINDAYVVGGGGSDGRYINEGSSVYSTVLSVYGYDNSLHLGDSGANIFDGIIDSYDSTTYDVYAEGALNNIHIAHGNIQRRKTEIGSNTYTSMTYDNFLRTFEVDTANNRFAVGSISNPSEAFFGEGDHKHRYLECLTNTNGEVGDWDDITDKIVVNDGVVLDVFSSNSEDACMYVGWNKTWGGLRYQCTTPIVGGTIVWEYWGIISTGPTVYGWKSFHTMVTSRQSPYTVQSGAFTNIAQEHIRFDTAITDDWAAKELFNITSYWVRVRIDTVLTTVPKLDLITIHADSMSIRRDGTTHYFGATRYTTFEQMTLAPSRKALKSSDFETLNVASGLIMYDNQKVLSNGEVNEIMFQPYLVSGNTDISCSVGLHFVIATPAVTGNAEFKVDFTFIAPDTSVYNGANTLLSMTTIVDIATESGGTPFKSIYVEMDTYLTGAMPADGVLYGRLYRDARSSNLNDTVADYIVVVSPKIEYKVWKQNKEEPEGY